MTDLETLISSVLSSVNYFNNNKKCIFEKKNQESKHQKNQRPIGHKNAKKVIKRRKIIQLIVELS